MRTWNWRAEIRAAHPDWSDKRVEAFSEVARKAAENVRAFGGSIDEWFARGPGRPPVDAMREREDLREALVRYRRFLRGDEADAGSMLEQASGVDGAATKEAGSGSAGGGSWLGGGGRALLWAAAALGFSALATAGVRGDAPGEEGFAVTAVIALLGIAWASLGLAWLHWRARGGGEDRR